MSHLGGPTVIKAGLEEAIFMNNSGAFRLFSPTSQKHIGKKALLAGFYESEAQCANSKKTLFTL